MIEKQNHGMILCKSESSKYVLRDWKTESRNESEIGQFLPV